MTAEVAALNRHAIALAADSAVTITHPDGQKVYNSVNKLFALKHAPVGIMIYGEADFMDVPWEPLIKVYRGALGRRKFATIAQHATHFVDFLRNHQHLQSGPLQDSTFRRRAIQFLLELIRSARELYRSAEADAAKTSTALDVAVEINKAVSAAVNGQDEMLEAEAELDGFNPAVVTKREPLLLKAMDDTFTIFFPEAVNQLTDEVKRSVVDVFSKAMGRNYFPSSSGVVVAGYGDDEMFPAMVSMELDGVYDGYLRYADETVSIRDDNPYHLQPFAQGDVVTTFMDGVHPRLADTLNATMSTLMSLLTESVARRMTGLDAAQDLQLRNLLSTTGSNIVATFDDFLRRFRTTYHEPITQALDVMPKEELAELAESLVHLTSTRRRVSMETESVGGPIDVAVISKGDGFIWLKRKHYFRPELNPQFFVKMLEQAVGGNDGETE